MAFVRYVRAIDAQVDAAMKMCIKRTLQALALLINGDNKTGPLPAFKVQTHLMFHTFELAQCLAHLIHTYTHTHTQ